MDTDEERDDEDFSWSPFRAHLDFEQKLYQWDKLRWRRFDAADTGHGLIARVMKNVKAGNMP